MKKLVALALIGVMSLGIFAGCGNGNEKNAAPAEQTNSNVEEREQIAAQAQEPLQKTGRKRQRMPARR